LIFCSENRTSQADTQFLAVGARFFGFRRARKVPQVCQVLLCMLFVCLGEGVPTMWPTRRSVLNCNNSIVGCRR